MGGNALKHTFTRRYEREEYFSLCSYVMNTLRAVGGFQDRNMAVLPSYGAKETFGDLDLLVSSSGLHMGVWQDIKDALKPQEFVRNGPVTSLNVDDFQVDLIMVPERLFKMHLAYYSFNDLGNLVGRVAAGAGFTYGGAGLLYRVYDPRYENTHIGTVELTTDPAQAMAFLGYDPSRFSKGFNTKQDIFEYAISSPLAYMDFFDLEKRNHRSRVRDAKRVTYSEFLQWVSLQDMATTPPPRHKEIQFKRACEFFPDLSVKVQAILNNYETWNLAKAALSVHDVAQWRQLKLSEAGPWFKRFQKMWPSHQSYNDWVLSSSAAERKSCVEQAEPPPSSAVVWTLSNVRAWSGLSGAAASEAFHRFPQQWLEPSDFKEWLSKNSLENVRDEFLRQYPSLVGEGKLLTPHSSSSSLEL